MISTETARHLRATYLRFTDAGDALAAAHPAGMGIGEDLALIRAAEEYCEARVAHQEAIGRADRGRAE